MMNRRKHLLSAVVPFAAAFMLEGCLQPISEKSEDDAAGKDKPAYAASVSVTWNVYSGQGASGIGAGAVDTAYIVEDDNQANGSHTVSRWTGPGGFFSSTEGTAFECDVGQDVSGGGSVWVIGSDSKVYESHDQGINWNSKGSRTFSEIGASSNNSAVWALGSGFYPGTSDQPIFKWNSGTSNWDSVGGAAIRIEVGPDGTPWVVNSSHDIYHGNTSGSSFGLFTSQKATDIGVGANGQIWIISNTAVGIHGDKTILEWDGSSWQEANGGAIRITVDADGDPWIVNGIGSTYQGNF